MLLNDFFRINDLHPEGDSARATLQLNPGHEIFSGHFPGQPVVPGACLLQMVEEMTAEITGMEWKLIRADHLKFIEMIDPGLDGILLVTITCKKEVDGKLHVSAGLSKQRCADPSKEPSACFTFKGVFQPA